MRHFLGIVLACLIMGCIGSTEGNTKAVLITQDAGSQSEHGRVEDCNGSADLPGCLDTLSLERGDIDICRLIPDDPLGNVVRNNCVQERLLESPNLKPENCSLYGGPFGNEMCLANAAILNDNLQICDLIKDENAGSWCIQKIANDRGDIGLCTGISVPAVRQYCEAVLGARPADCGRIQVSDQTSWWQDSCAQEVAVAAGNVSACGLVSAENKRGECVGAINADPSACDTTPDWDGYWCRKYVAIKARDPSVCDNIRDAGIIPDEVAILECKALASRDRRLCERIDGARHHSTKSDCRINANLLARGLPGFNWNGPSPY
jgi:hypothetical protein